MNIDNRKKGVLLAFLGVFILSPDSLLVRLIDEPFYTLMFWRGLFMFLSLSLYLLYQHKKDFLKLYSNITRSTVLVGVLFVCSTYLFVASLHHTSVAHTLLIVGASPLFSAIFALLILKEAPQLRVWIGMAVIMLALTMVVQQQEQLVTLKGDLYALLSSIITGYIFVYVRQHKDINLIMSLSLNGLGIAIVALFLASTLQVTLLNGTLLLLLGASGGLAFSLITLSVRYMPAPITGMFMPLETVFGVSLVWLFIAEQPSLITIIGGATIILTLIVISFFELRSKPKI